MSHTKIYKQKYEGNDHDSEYHVAPHEITVRLIEFIVSHILQMSIDKAISTLRQQWQQHPNHGHWTVSGRTLHGQQVSLGPSANPHPASETPV